MTTRLAPWARSRAGYTRRHSHLTTDCGTAADRGKAGGGVEAAKSEDESSKAGRNSEQTHRYSKGVSGGEAGCERATLANLLQRSC